MKKTLFFIIVLFAIPGISFSAENITLDVEISFTAPIDPTRVHTGYTLYKDGVQVCTTDDPAATAIACDILSDAGVFDFTLTALYSDSTESPHSSPFPVNIELAPVALASTISGSEDTPISGTFAVDNTNGLALQYSIYSQPEYGTLTVNDVTGSFIYTPFANFNGQDLFTFTAANSHGVSNLATVSITVNGVNDAPVAQTASITANEDNSVSGQLTASDDDEDRLTYFLEGQAGNGNAIVNANGTFTYSPDENWNGTDSFTFSVYDSTVHSNTATVNINVQAVNDTPVANNQSIAVNAGTTTNGLLTAFDVEGDTLEFSTTSAPSQGTILVNYDGSFSYTANQDATGSDSFSFTVSDGSSNSSSATVSIAITEQYPSFVFELIEIQADSNWQSITFNTPFTHPVVIARTASFNDNQTGVVRVRDVTSNGLELRFQEWDSLDDSHPGETITIMVIEAGSFILENGEMVEAGCFPESGTTTFTSVSFQQVMTAAPVVLTAVNSVNEADAVTTRVRNITVNGFELMMQEQEVNEISHAKETVCYLAWEPSIGSLDNNVQFEVAATDVLITSNDFPISYSSQFVETPFLLAGQQTTNGGDTAVLRIRSNTPDTMSVFVSEEQSYDPETDHIAESGGYIAIASNDPSDPTDQDPPSVEVTLMVDAYKVKGKKYADLTWGGVNSKYVAIYRDGGLLAENIENYEYTHGPFSSGKAATYKICDETASPSVCSNEVTVAW